MALSAAPNLPPWLGEPVGKDVLLTERKRAIGEQLAQNKDAKAMGNVPCVVTSIPEAGAQNLSTRPLGSVHAVVGSNVVLCISVHTQRPLINLRLRSLPEGPYDSTVHFDPDYLQGVTITEIEERIVQQSEYTQEFERIYANGMSWNKVAGTWTARNTAEERSPAVVGKIVRIHMKLWPQDDERRTLSFYKQDHVDRRLYGPVQNFATLLVSDSRDIVIHVRAPDAKSAYIRENLRLLKELLRLRQRLVREGHRPQSNFLAASHPHWEESANDWSSYQIFRQQKSAPLRQPWLRLPDQNGYAFAFSQNEIKQAPALFNPRQLIGTLAQATLWDIHYTAATFNEFFGESRRYEVLRKSGRGSTTSVLQLRLSDLKSNERPLSPRNGQIATLTLDNQYNPNGTKVSFQGKIFVSHDKDWPLQLIVRPLISVGQQRFSGTLKIEADVTLEAQKLVAMEHLGGSESHLPSKGGDLIGFSLIKTLMGRIEHDRRSPNFLADYQLYSDQSQDDIDAALDDIDEQLDASDPDQSAFLGGLLTGVSGAVAVLAGYEGCGKTTTECKGWYAFARLGLRVLVVSHSNTVADVALSKNIDLVKETASKHILPGQALRIYAPATEAALEMRVEDDLAQASGEAKRRILWEELERSDRHVRDQLRQFSLSWTINRIARASDGNDRNSIEYLKHRAARARHEMDPTISSSYTYETTRDYLARQALSHANMVFTTAAMAPQAASLGYKPDLIFIEEGSTLNARDAICALRPYGRVPLIGVAGDARQLAPVCASAEALQNPYGNFLQQSVLEMWPAANPSIHALPCRYNYRQVQELFDLSNTCFYKGDMIMGQGSTERENTSFSNSINAALHSGGVLGGLLRSCAMGNRRLIVLDVDSPDERTATNSRFNRQALLVAAELFSQLSQNGVFKHGSDALITPYAADRDMWSDCLQTVGCNSTAFPALTVDASQGDQADISVVNMVRGTVAHKPFGILNDKRRLNVMTSRGRQFAVYICNLRAWRQSAKQNPLLPKLNAAIWKVKDYLERHAHIVNVPQDY
jgi:hypothetical protein